MKSNLQQRGVEGWNYEGKHRKKKRKKNTIHRMELKHLDWNLAKKSGMDQDLEWDEICFGLFYYLE